MIDIRKVARQSVQELDEYVPGKPIEEVKRELGLDDALKLASNENPLGTSPKAMAAMMRELQENAHLYPEGACPMLAARLAEVHHLHPGQFYINNGVDGVLSSIGAAFIDCQDETVTSRYSFFAYQSITRRMGGKVILVPQTPDYRFDVDGMIAALSPRTKIVFLCNPNNPTGTIIYRDEFERLMSAVSADTLVVSDEAYYDFADDPEYPQTVPYLANHSNLVITRTFSKIGGLAGLRVGYAMAHPEVVRMLRKVCDPFPVNRIAQAGALASLDDAEFLHASVEVVHHGREQLYEGLRRLDLRPASSQANFVFVDLGVEAEPVYQTMLRKGVIVRPMGPQGMPTCLRITVGLPEQNSRALIELASALGCKEALAV
ncbi:MAG: histidinol-phosphate transaminase [Chloroflexi bacterium]|nr:histidinol-phosphate transaminase [Chloroflexota bacterium]